MTILCYNYTKSWSPDFASVLHEIFQGNSLHLKNNILVAVSSVPFYHRR